MVGIHVQVDKYIQREVEETLSGVYVVNIHLQVETSTIFNDFG
jgi:hypothetical protein